MNVSTSTFAPRWLCIISACLWIFPFTLLSYLLKNTEFALFLLICYIFACLCPFLKLSISSLDNFEDFPGWRSAQAIAILPASISIHFLFGEISFPSISLTSLVLFIVFLVWYFFLGQLPLVILYPISKFCVQLASKIYFSKKIVLKLLSFLSVIAFCYFISLFVFSGSISSQLVDTVPENLTFHSIHEEPRQGEEVSKESETVWIPTHGGTKYHRRSTCSGMEDPEKTTKEDAISRGFEACQRCY